MGKDNKDNKKKEINTIGSLGCGFIWVVVTNKRKEKKKISILLSPSHPTDVRYFLARFRYIVVGRLFYCPCVDSELKD